MKRLLAPLVLLLVLTGFGLRHAADAAEEAAVRQTAAWYLEGTGNRSTEALHRAFHPDAFLVFIGDQGYTRLPFPEWADRVAKSTGPRGARKAEVTSVDVTHDAAVAKITIETGGQRITDYLSMLKIDGEWKIVNKIFTREAM